MIIFPVCVLVGFYVGKKSSKINQTSRRFFGCREYALAKKKQCCTLFFDNKKLPQPEALKVS